MPSRGTDVGYYTIPLIPSIEGFGPNIDRQMSKAFAGVSKSASRAISSGFNDGMADAERAVKASSQKIVALREKEADAAGKLRVAEQRLADVRDSGKGGATLVRAEEAREKALRGQATALRSVESETRSLEQAQQRLADAQRDVAKGPSGGAGGWLDGISSKAKQASEALKGIGEDAIGGLAGGGGEAGGAFLDGFSGKIAAIGTKAGPIGVAIAAAATVALAGGSLIAEQVMAGLDHQQQKANVAAKLGVDEPTMKRIADAAGQAYGSNFGESIEGNLDAARVAIQTGLVGAGDGAGVRKMVEQLDTVSTVLGTDIPATALAAQQAIVNGLAPNATSAFDLLVKGQQAGLNTSDDLLDTLNEYPTLFRELGLDGPEALGLISQAMKGGARNSDLAADALKEFSLRAVDGSKTTVDGFTKIGLNADQMAEKIAAGGKSAHDGLGQVLDGLRNIKDPVEQSRVAVELFGTQAEDLGQALFKFDLSNAVNQLGDVDGAAQRASDTLGNTGASSVETARRQIELGLQGMQDSLATAFGPLITDLANSFTAHQPEIIGFFTGVADAALAFSQTIAQTVSEAARGLAFLVNAVGDTVGGIAKAMEVTSRFLGNDEAAADFKKTADEAFGWADGIYEVADAAEGARVGLGKARDAIQEGADAAQNAAGNVDLLKSGITTLPNGTVTINDTTPANIQRVKDLGYAVTTLPNGQVAIAVQYMLDGRPISREQLVTPIRVAATPGGTAPTFGGGRAAGGIFNGLDSVASFLGGKLPDAAMIQPAVAGGGLVQWAEPSTGGEAFIPINGGDRSVDIWQETGRRLGVWKFEAGGFRGLNALVSEAQSLVGHPYSMASGDDCSGSISQLVNAALGLAPKADRMSTATAAQWLPAKGAVLGVGPPGTFRIGWKNGGPGGGHMAATLPDGTHVEQGGSTNGFTLGSGAAGAEDSQFTDHAYLPLNVLYPDGYASGGASSPYGGTGGGGGGSVMGPDGTMGSYSVDQSAVQEASGKVAEADANVREKEATLRELKSDAKESERIRTQNDLDKARNDAAEARQKLGEAQQGKFTAGKGGGAGGPDVSDLGKIFGSFLTETTGLDGSLFPDIGELPAVKMLGTVLGFAKAAAGGNSADGATPGIAGFGGGGGLPFGMIPAGFGEPAGQAAAGMAPPGSPASGVGFGAPPGPVDNSRNVAVTVNGIDENRVADNVRRQVLNVDRLGTYTTPGMN